MKNISIALAVLTFGLVLWSCQPQKKEAFVLTAPAGDRPTKIVKGGETVLPNGRIITPYGNTFTVAPHPFGLTLSHDGTVAVTANSGTSPLSISLFSGY